MNLADAIRRAAVAPAVGQVISTGLHQDAERTLAQEPELEPEPEVLDLHAADHVEVAEPSGLSTTSGPGLIRLELFLPPEQVNRLVKSVTAAHHSVLTLREAASHLRISPARLEEMAAERKVPAFQVDGRWRFSRSRLDEWVACNEWEKENAS
jgi:excisionase family DNA binding protein